MPRRRWKDVLAPRHEVGFWLDSVIMQRALEGGDTSPASETLAR